MMSDPATSNRLEAASGEARGLYRANDGGGWTAAQTKNRTIVHDEEALILADHEADMEQHAVSNGEEEEGATSHSLDPVRRTQHRKDLPSMQYIVFRYVGLASLAVLVTILCPGSTILWRKSNHDSSQPSKNWKCHLQWSVLIPLLATLLGTLTLFARLVGSDPGYLTHDIMEQLDHVREGIELDDPFVVQSHKIKASDSIPKRPHMKQSSSWDASTDPLAPTPSATSGNDSNNDDDDDVVRPLVGTNNTTLPRSLRRKYCAICHIYPPLRAHHCKQCQQCVATFDHHCDFLQTCIGEQNHGWFVLFLTMQAIGFATCVHIINSSSLGWTTLLFSSSSAADDPNHPQDEIMAVMVVLIKCYLYPLTAMAYVMWLVHFLLISSNTTTFECARHRRLDYMDGMDITDCPFSQGLCWNWNFALQGGGGGGGNSRNETGTHQQQPTRQQQQQQWLPHLWLPPSSAALVRDSPEWWNHLWQNKYWSCC